MVRRIILTVSRVAFLFMALVAIFLLILPYLQAMRERQVRRELEENWKQFGLGPLPRQWLEEPRLQFKAVLDGETTILTVTVVNPNQISIKEAAFPTFKLGTRWPMESATLPVRVRELAPGASQQFVLHYNHDPRFNDEVGVDPIHIDWAVNRLDLSGSWFAWEEPNVRAGGENPTAKASTFHLDFQKTYPYLSLDPESARALKERDEERLKADAQTKIPHTEVDPSPKS
jgi:hypothetical protein